MVEIGIGILFAVLFVAAYLLVSKLLGKDRRWREIADQPTGPKTIAAKPSKLFLTTNEMSEHHAGSKGARGR
jgi:hypothetical protein